MNNIQKAFKNKAKCGLRMAVGGVIEPALVDQQAIKAGTVDPNGSDFDTINAERTLRWAADDAASAQKHRQPFAPTMAATDLAKGLLSQPQSAQPAQPVQAAQPAASADTTFEQDMNARDARIRGYGKGLGRSYADGGVIQETPDQIMERMSAKYGLPAAGPVKPAQAPVQQAAPQPPAQQQKPGLMDRLRNVATGNLEGRMRAAGMAEGGIVRGKGGPTDDEVPMNVGGVDVNLSNKEAVLPAKTVEALGGTEAVEDMIEITNGKPPVRHGLRAGGEYADGALAERPWYAGTDSRDERTGLEMERARRAESGVEGDVIKSIALSGTTGKAPVPATPAVPPVSADKSPVVPLAVNQSATPVAAPKRDLRSALAEQVDPVVVDRAVAAPDKRADFMAEQDATKFDLSGVDGGGVITRAPDKNGLRQATMILGPSASDAASDARFTAAGTKKDAYGNWMSDQRLGDKAALAQMQQERTLRDAFDPNITDPTVQANARARLGYDLAGQQIAAKGGLEQARLLLDKARFDREGKQQDREQANKDKEFEFKDNEAHTKRVDDLVKSWATGDDGKLDNQRYTQLQKYASQFKRGKGASSDQHLRELIDNFAVDDLFEKQGRHWSSPEGVSSGEAVARPSLRQAGASALLDARLPGQASYRDPLTQRVIYQSDVVNQLSPAQQKILAERVGKQ